MKKTSIKPIHVLEEPIILLAPRFIKDYFGGLPSSEYDHTLVALREQFDAISEMGYQVKVLGLKNSVEATSCISDLCDDLEDIRPGSVLPLSFQRIDTLKSILWPRDIFTVLDGVVYCNPKIMDVAEEIFHELGIHGSYDFVSSFLGEGGLLAGNGQVRLVSEYIRESDMDILKERGYSVEILPVPDKSEHSVLALRMNNQHIDTEVNAVQNSSDELLVLANGLYEETYPESIEKLRERSNTQVFVQDPELIYGFQKEINFPMFPNGEVLLVHRAEGVKDFLEQHLPSGHIHQLTLEWSYGVSGQDRGLRCMTNEIV